MPFKSEKQRRFMHANHPEIAERWEDEAKDKGESSVQKDDKDDDDRHRHPAHKHRGKKK